MMTKPHVIIEQIHSSRFFHGPLQIILLPRTLIKGYEKEHPRIYTEIGDIVRVTGLFFLNISFSSFLSILFEIHIYCGEK